MKALLKMEGNRKEYKTIATLQFKELEKKNKLNPKLAEKGNNKDKGFT